MLTFTLSLRQVFEPLHPKHNAAVQELTGFDPRIDHASSFYLRPGGTYPAWDRLLEAVLTGQVRTPWTDAAPVAPSSQGFLIKMIRANLLLGYLYDRFQPQLIYLVRHPCAVVNSRLKIGWTANSQALLRQEELVEDYLRPWIAHIERETDAVGSHALWWAVENLVAQRQLANRPHYRIFYEHLVIDPAQEARRIAGYTGRESKDIPQAVLESRSRTSYRVGADALIAPLLSWKEELSHTDQRRVIDWADRLGVSWYGMDIWPGSLSG